MLVRKRAPRQERTWALPLDREPDLVHTREPLAPIGPRQVHTRILPSGQAMAPEDSEALAMEHRSRESCLPFWLHCMRQCRSLQERKAPAAYNSCLANQSHSCSIPPCTDHVHNRLVGTGTSPCSLDTLDSNGKTWSSELSSSWCSPGRSYSQALWVEPPGRRQLLTRAVQRRALFSEVEEVPSWRLAPLQHPVKLVLRSPPMS